MDLPLPISDDLPISMRNPNLYDLLFVTARFLEWDLLPQQDFERRIDFSFRKIIGKSFADNTERLDFISATLEEARATIGVYPPMVITYELIEEEKK